MAPSIPLTRSGWCAALIWFWADVVLSFDASKVAFFPKPSGVYNTTPKIRLKGMGFMEMAENLDSLQLTFDPPCEKGTTYKLDLKADDCLTLVLQPEKRWIDGKYDQPKTLMLVGASFDGQELLTENLEVATIIGTPSVTPSTSLVYMTATPYILVNGTNFSTKQTKIFYSPPLREGSDVVTTVQSSTLIRLDLVRSTTGSAKWANEPGPLKIVAIDTGMGPCTVRPDTEGVVIAEVQADLDGHGVSVESHELVNMYQSTKVLTVAGKGFVPGNTSFRFANTLSAERDYTVEVLSESATFTLVAGSKWHQNSAILPTPLVLLSVDAGAGWVALGGSAKKAGRKVATVFEDPRVDNSTQEISRVLTHEFVVRGTGFTDQFAPYFLFEPPLERDDYKVQVLNRTRVKLTLATYEADRGWMPAGHSGPLIVRGINTGGGVIVFDNPSTVAVVTPDPDTHHSGVVVEPGHMQLTYQSSPGSVQIKGTGFPESENIVLTFGFNGPEKGTFDVIRVSETLLEVTMHDGVKWTNFAGPLLMSKISFDDSEVSWDSPGIKVAHILDDPLVEASNLHIYASKSKYITVKGKGLTSAFDPYKVTSIELEPTVPENVIVKDKVCTPNSVTISLIAGAWAEVGPDGPVPVKVISIDTGAGPVVMPDGGVTVASVWEDDEYLNCDDTCLYAEDGICDEDRGAPLGTGSTGSYDNAASSSLGRTDGLDGSSPTLSFGGNTDDFDGVLPPTCELGTDCSDCGQYVTVDGTCVDTCNYAKDNTCDDRRGTGICADGTDCQDCGPWGEMNDFVKVDISTDVSSYPNDDESFMAQPSLLMGQTSNADGRFKRVFSRHDPVRKESEQMEGAFMEVLWSAIVVVGAAVSLGLAFIVYRSCKGERVHLPIPQNPDVERR